MAYKIEINYQTFLFTKLEDALNCFRSFAASVQVDSIYPKNPDGTNNYQLDSIKVGHFPRVTISFCEYDVLDEDEYNAMSTPRPLNNALKSALDNADTLF